MTVIYSGSLSLYCGCDCGGSMGDCKDVVFDPTLCGANVKAHQDRYWWLSSDSGCDAQPNFRSEVIDMRS